MKIASFHQLVRKIALGSEANMKNLTKDMSCNLSVNNYYTIERVRGDLSGKY